MTTHQWLRSAILALSVFLFIFLLYVYFEPTYDDVLAFFHIKEPQAYQFPAPKRRVHYPSTTSTMKTGKQETIDESEHIIRKSFPSNDTRAFLSDEARTAVGACRGSVNTDPATHWVAYHNPKSGIMMKLPYNPKWGTEQHKIYVYEEGPDALTFGPVIGWEGCSLSRLYFMYFRPPKDFDATMAEIKEKSLIGEPTILHIVPNVPTVVKYVENGFVAFTHYIVLGRKYNYEFTTFGDPSLIDQVINTIAFPDADGKFWLSTGEQYDEEICQEKFRNDPPDGDLWYMNKERGLKFLVRSNSYWGNEYYKFYPYEEISKKQEDGFDTLAFGRIIVGFEGGCGLGREWTMGFRPARSADEAIEEFSKYSPQDKPLRKVEIDGLTVVEYEQKIDAYCNETMLSAGLEVMGKKHNYWFPVHCGRQMEDLEALVKTIQLID